MRQDLQCPDATPSRGEPPGPFELAHRLRSWHRRHRGTPEAVSSTAPADSSPQVGNSKHSDSQVSIVPATRLIKVKVFSEKRTWPRQFLSLSLLISLISCKVFGEKYYSDNGRLLMSVWFFQKVVHVEQPQCFPVALRRDCIQFPQRVRHTQWLTALRYLECFCFSGLFSCFPGHAFVHWFVMIPMNG